VDQVPEDLREIQHAAPIRDLDVAESRQGLKEHERIGGAAPFLLIVVARHLAGFGRQRMARFRDQLFTGRLGATPGRKAARRFPAYPPSPQTHSALAVGAMTHPCKATNCCASSFRVHRVRPSGAGPQARAIRRAPCAHPIYGTGARWVFTEPGRVPKVCRLYEASRGRVERLDEPAIAPPRSFGSVRALGS
jgi:hypothetical protein